MQQQSFPLFNFLDAFGKRKQWQRAEDIFSLGRFVLCGDTLPEGAKFIN